MDTTPPKRLTGVALDTWTRLAQQLVDDQTLTEASYVEFVAYCDAVADYEHARVELDKREGSRVAKTSTGAEQQIPELSMANRALETLLKLGERFALDSFTRERRGKKPKGATPSEASGPSLLTRRPTG